MHTNFFPDSWCLALNFSHTNGLLVRNVTFSYNSSSNSNNTLGTVVVVIIVDNSNSNCYSIGVVKRKE